MGRPVTGPDGDNPITAGQIYALRIDPTIPNEIYFDCNQLQWGRWDAEIARRVVEAWNARHGGAS